MKVKTSLFGLILGAIFLSHLAYAQHFTFWGMPHPHHHYGFHKLRDLPLVRFVKDRVVLGNKRQEAPVVYEIYNKDQKDVQINTAKINGATQIDYKLNLQARDFAAFYLAEHRLDFVCHQELRDKARKVPCEEVLDVRAVQAVSPAATQASGWISANVSQDNMCQHVYDTLQKDCKRFYVA
ncbi:MAG: hypothetical protein K0S08_312 [Gammaproteobacteria bacterium]|jgi:hypothetical protein|nr:hypothetical protein [Gammaproteobacteria bacterium]